MHYTFFCAILISVNCLGVMAQSFTGITGKQDTSYSTYSAYLSTVKTHPGIKIVPEYHSPLITEKRNIVYCNAGKRSLYIDGFYPKQKSNKPRPAIMIIHGGGWRTGNRTQHYPPAQRLAALGYICYTPEYRLSTEALYPTAVNDLKSALRWMRTNAKKENIGTAKIAVLGFSARWRAGRFFGYNR